MTKECDHEVWSFTIGTSRYSRSMSASRSSGKSAVLVDGKRFTASAIDDSTIQDETQTRRETISQHKMFVECMQRLLERERAMIVAPDACFAWNAINSPCFACSYPTGFVELEEAKHSNTPLGCQDLTGMHKLDGLDYNACERQN